MKKNLFLALVSLAVFSAGSLRAREFNATTANLQEHLNTASGNGEDDVIWLADGHYVGNFNFNSAEARSLTLQPEANLANPQIFIDGVGGTSMNLASSANANFTVRGITFLRNCGAQNKSGLRIAGGSGSVIALEGCRFVSPTNTTGMGLEIVSGLNVTVNGCTALGSRSGGGGIGMLIQGITGELTVRNCTIATNNSAGGSSISGLRVSGGNVSVLGNTFLGNTGSHGGGGATCSGTTSVTVFGNTFTGNTSSSVGAIEVGGSTSLLTMSSNTFTANSGQGAGGAYCNMPSGTIMMVGNIFARNSSGGANGGAYCSGIVTLMGNTFVSNSAAGGFGGGAQCLGTPGSTMTLTDNTFSGNSASGAGGGLYCKANGNDNWFLDVFRG